MRIVLLSHLYLPHVGGIEIVVNHLAREFSRDHHVCIVTAGRFGEERVAEEDGISVHRLPSLHLAERMGIPYPLPLGPGIGRALEAIRSADVLHVHGALYPASLLAALMARRHGIPLVLTEHVGLVPYRSRALGVMQDLAWRWIGDFVIRAASVLVACGDRVARWMTARHPRGCVQVIPNGVDARRFRPLDAAERAAARDHLRLPRDRTLALFVGRHSEKKNLGAVLQIPRHDFDLVLCGSDRRISDAGVRDLGILPYDRMPRLLGCVDMLVHAGTGEGFPLVVQESLASGVPVVLLWDAGYGPVIDRSAVRACDSLDEFSREVQALARDRGARDELRRAASTYARRRWSWSRTAGGYLDVYRQAMTATERGALIHAS